MGAVNRGVDIMSFTEQTFVFIIAVQGARGPPVKKRTLFSCPKTFQKTSKSFQYHFWYFQIYILYFKRNYRDGFLLFQCLYLGQLYMPPRLKNNILPKFSHPCYNAQQRGPPFSSKITPFKNYPKSFSAKLL